VIKKELAELKAMIQAEDGRAMSAENKSKQEMREGWNLGTAVLP